MAGGAVAGVISTVARAFGSISKFTMVFKEVKDVLKEITNTVNKLSSPWREIENQAYKAGRTMAMTRDEIKNYNAELRETLRAYGAAYNMTAEEIAQIQVKYSEATGRNIKLANAQIGQMSALSKIVDPTLAAQLSEEYEKIGAGVGHTLANTELIQERAKSLGLNATAAAKGLAENIKLASRYSFRGGVDDIQKMVLKSQSLKMNMASITSAMDKFMDIEGAISTAANVQVLGGTFATAFNNPMQAMYEAEADPNAFMDRITSAIEGKGKYDKKTGTVTFDPVTMRIIREAANQLGMSVEDLTKSSSVKAQNDVIERELRNSAASSKFDAKQREAIYNLARGNVDEETGEHYINYLHNGNVERVNVAELTEEQLEIAAKSQLTEEQLWTDVHSIRELMENAQNRAQESLSLDESVHGIKQTFKGIFAGLTNWIMSPISNFANTISNQSDNIWGDKFAKGGIVRAATGAVLTQNNTVPGNSYTGDKVPVMANSGEMILNQNQQANLFRLAATGSLVAGGGYMAYKQYKPKIKKFGGKLGMGGMGKSFLISNLLTGGDSGIGDVLMTHMMLGGLKGMKNGRGLIGGAADSIKPTINKVEAGLNKFGLTLKGTSKDVESVGKEFKETGESVKQTNSEISKTSSRWAKIKAANPTFSPLGQSLNSPTSTSSTTPYAIPSNKKPSIGTRIQTAASNAVTKVRTAFAPSNVKSAFAPKNFFKSVGAGSKAFGVLGTVLSVGSAIGGISAANSQFDEKVKNIENSGMSDPEKAKAVVTARKERNENRGKSVGEGVGAVAGAALGSVLGPLGTIAGGFIGGIAGKALGGLVGGLFGGGKRLKPKKKKGSSVENTTSEEQTGAVAANESNSEYSSTESGSISESSGVANERVVTELKAIRAKMPTAGTSSTSVAKGRAKSITNGAVAGGIFGPIGSLIGSIFGGSDEDTESDDLEEAKEKLASKSSKGIFGTFGSIFKAAIKSNPITSAIGRIFGGDNESVELAKNVGVNPNDVSGGTSDVDYTSLNKFIDYTVKNGIRVDPKSFTVFENTSKVVSDIIRPKDELNYTKVSSPQINNDNNMSKISLEGNNIGLNVNGSIRLEGNGQSAQLDIEKLLNSPSFVRQITDIIVTSLSTQATSSRKNLESVRNNSANQYNKTGA